LNPDSLETVSQRLWSVLVRWMLTAISVWVATCMVRGVDYADWQSLFAAAMILGILNTLVKPILILVALPLVLLSLGFMLLIINALLLILTSRLVPGFHVDGFWSALGASLIISIVSLILGNKRTRRRRAPGPPPSGEAYQEPSRTRTPPPGKGPIIDV